MPDRRRRALLHAGCRRSGAGRGRGRPRPRCRRAGSAARRPPRCRWAAPRHDAGLDLDQAGDRDAVELGEGVLRPVDRGGEELGPLGVEASRLRGVRSTLALALDAGDDELAAAEVDVGDPSPARSPWPCPGAAVPSWRVDAAPTSSSGPQADAPRRSCPCTLPFVPWQGIRVSGCGPLLTRSSRARAWVAAARPTNRPRFTPRAELGRRVREPHLGVGLDQPYVEHVRARLGVAAVLAEPLLAAEPDLEQTGDHDRLARRSGSPGTCGGAGGRRRR